MFKSKKYTIGGLNVDHFRKIPLLFRIDSIEAIVVNEFSYYLSISRWEDYLRRILNFNFYL
jgi:hypothetical protein